MIAHQRHLQHLWVMFHTQESGEKPPHKSEILPNSDCLQKHVKDYRVMRNGHDHDESQTIAMKRRAGLEADVSIEGMLSCK